MLDSKTAIALDTLLDVFEDTWHRGVNPDVRQYLPKLEDISTDGKDMRSIVCELVMIDVWHRWRIASEQMIEEQLAELDQDLAGETCGLAPLSLRARLEDYVAAFPIMGEFNELPLPLICEEYRARCQWGDNPSSEEYLSRFPSRASDVELALSNIRIGRSCPPDGLTTDFVAASDEWWDLLARGTGEAPESIGKYHVVEMLEPGGQADVCRALQPGLGREVIIKRCRPSSVGDKVNVEHLRSEGRLLAQLKHPNLAQVYDFDVHNGLPFLVMEHIRGRNLRHYVEHNPVSHSTAASIVAKIARALDYVHANGVVHHDLKPANIMIDDESEPRIIDFGLAQCARPVVEDGALLTEYGGTISFISPEQALRESKTLNHRSDIFGAGAILYWLLVNRAPFGGKNCAEILENARECRYDEEIFQVKEISPQLRRICTRAMARDPADRYATAGELAQDLERYLQRGRYRRRKFLAAAACLLLVATWVLWPSSGSTPMTPEELVGRPLHQSFALEVDFVGKPDLTDGRVSLVVGEPISLRIKPDSDVYLGIWWFDSQGKSSMLFPNELEKDNRIAAGATRIVPGEAYKIEALLSDGDEYLWVAASRKPWDTDAGETMGPDAVFVPGPELVDNAEYKKELAIRPAGETAPAVSEYCIRFRVSQSDHRNDDHKVDEVNKVAEVDEADEQPAN